MGRGGPEVQECGDRSVSARTQKTAASALPGDLDKSALIDRILRVDHAGEFGAKRIYEGQLAVLGKSSSKETLEHMRAQELEHLAAFEKLMVNRRARPTILQPLWHVAGFALGAGTALLGEKAAMACTIAVEEVIDEHYASQTEQLGDDEAELRETLESFRAEEQEHRDIGIAHGGEDAPGYPVLKRAVQAGSRAAIWLSERI
ncbi:MAG: demethoxyubiquinone hydroxylase family protein [Rhodospirillaceae bacterium]|nr:demethoxyubiquinone hydroxylase family protein [Rhodospirillaceae bacterium]